MDSLKIHIINQDAILILKGLEQVGLITLQYNEEEKTQLSKQLRGTVSSTKALEMMKYVENERAEWDDRY